MCPCGESLLLQPYSYSMRRRYENCRGQLSPLLYPADILSTWELSNFQRIQVPTPRQGLTYPWHPNQLYSWESNEGHIKRPSWIGIWIPFYFHSSLHIASTVFTSCPMRAPSKSQFSTLSTDLARSLENFAPTPPPLLESVLSSVLVV